MQNSSGTVNILSCAALSELKFINMLDGYFKIV